MSKQDTNKEILIRVELKLEELHRDIQELKLLEARIDKLEEFKDNAKGMAVLGVPVIGGVFSFLWIIASKIFGI